MRTVASRYRDVPASDMQRAYAGLARYYDFIFGPLLGSVRAAGVRALNALPGGDVLEVGVGTGLALSQYREDKRVIGIDLSADMLKKARRRVVRRGLERVEALLRMDAQNMAFRDARFDIVVAMFVASVVPEPRALLKEMRRVAKPGGTLIFVNHFAGTRQTARRRRLDRITEKLGWRGDFRLEDLFDEADLALARRKRLGPFGMFQLVELPQPGGS